MCVYVYVFVCTACLGSFLVLLSVFCFFFSLFFWFLLDSVPLDPDRRFDRDQSMHEQIRKRVRVFVSLYLAER